MILVTKGSSLGVTGIVGSTLSDRAVKRDGPFGFCFYAMLYAVECTEPPFRIKFGRTLDVQRRFRSLRTASPVELRLAGYCWMPDDAEPHLFTFLRDDRLHGEWFSRTERTRAMLALIAAKEVKELAIHIGLQMSISPTEAYGVKHAPTII